MSISRRNVVFGGLTAGAVALFKPGTPARAQALNVRRNIATVLPADPLLETYRKAVSRMMALPITDGRNWYRQAKIHRDLCCHGNWFFLAWHREYLRHFEEIVRELGEDDTFCLPYWDWISDRQVPAAFWAAAVAGNPLDVANLDFASFEAVDPTLAALNGSTGRARLIDSAGLVGDSRLFTPDEFQRRVLDMGAFTDIASIEASELQSPIRRPSEFENSYHGSVHIYVGGPMSRFYSPLDPIFWLHHANVDRIWSLWSDLHPVTLPDTWLDFVLPAGMFFDRAGNPTGEIVCRKLSTTAGLMYEYETVSEQQAGLVRFGAESILESAPAPLLRVAGDTQVQLNSFASFFAEAPDALVKALTAPDLVEMSVKRQPTLLAATVEVGSISQAPRSELRVFLNCDYLTPETPSEDPHFVGIISLFGLADAESGHHGTGPTQLAFDLSPTLVALRRAQRVFDNKLELQIQAVPLPGTSTEQPTPATIAAFEFAVSPTIL